jgi:hypothetical protein
LPLVLVEQLAIRLLARLLAMEEILISLEEVDQLPLLGVVAVDRITMVAARLGKLRLLIISAEVVVEVVAEVVNQNIQLQTRLRLLLHTPTVMATTVELIFQTFLAVARGKALEVVALVRQAGR